MDQEWHNHLQGQQPTKQIHNQSLQPAAPWGLAGGATESTHLRHQQGRIRQWDRSHSLHPIGKMHGTSERDQSAEGVAHQHRRPLNHLV
jgi:hypothetical protein